MGKQQDKEEYQKSETPKIKKDKTILTTSHYNTPRTSLLVFHFEPHSFRSPELRIRDAFLSHHLVEGKDLYVIDNYFLADESQELRAFSSRGEFNRSIFAQPESREKGETPARAMDNKEKWAFFSNPPQAVKELYKLLSLMAYHLDAEITTLPWELCDETICAPAVATNRIEQLSSESMDLGKHQDYNTEKGLSFGIPILYAKEKEYYTEGFVNGETGKPWLISIMLYSTSPEFLPEYGLGTVFFSNEGNIAVRSDCRHMRFVLFEGDIFHSIEKSDLPIGVKAWRVSYVFKLAVNPKRQNQNLKRLFTEFIQAQLRSK